MCEQQLFNSEMAFGMQTYRPGKTYLASFKRKAYEQ